MQEHDRRRWLELCVEAAICEDPERLVELAGEIMTILHEEQQRLESPKVLTLRR